MDEFDYQSDRHCSKTLPLASCPDWCLITSQIDTAPKQRALGVLSGQV